MMNTANKLTLARIFMIPIFIGFAMFDNLWTQIAALAIFIAASLTDFADGYIARKYNLVTNFGKFTDPLADKLLTLSAMIIFISTNQMNAVAVFIIVARELMVTGLRTVALEKGRVLAASWTGKVKTCVQMGGIILIMLANILTLAGVNCCQEYLNTVFGWTMAAVTFYSGWDYMSKNIDVIFDSPKNKV